MFFSLDIRKEITGLFNFFVLSCISCLHILEINHLSVVSFANIFSHSKCYLFVLFIVSFAVQKLLSLIRPHLCVFIFIIRQWIEKDLAVIYVRECSAYIFICEFYSICPYIWVFNPFWIYCCVWC